MNLNLRYQYIEIRDARYLIKVSLQSKINTIVIQILFIGDRDDETDSDDDDFGETKVIKQKKTTSLHRSSKTC